MLRYNGIPKDHFHLFLKECEWRRISDWSAAGSFFMVASKNSIDGIF
jgi:transposase-like protein